MRPCEIWIEQCEAARQIEAEFGTQNALDSLIGEKFMKFLQAAETDAEFRDEIPAFVGGIKTIFETWQLAAYLETARQTEPFDPSIYEDEDEDYDPELVEDERRDDLRRSASDLLLVLGRTGTRMAPGGRRLAPDRFLGGSPTIIVLVGCLVHGDSGFRHQVHGLARWQERQLLETQLHDDLGDGFLDFAFELFDGLGVHVRHQSDLFVLSVFS
jgi:hypothetical protein